MSPLRTCLGPYAYLAPFKDGRIGIPGVDLSFVEVNPMIAAYRKMVRALEYDICEVAVTTYIVAKVFDKGFTALPIPLNHMFHFGDVQVALDAGIEQPRDLAGKRVGVRAYTVTTGVWVRGILQSEYGVDPAAITWVTDDEEHVSEYVPPPNVVASDGASLVDLFQTGKIDVAFSGRAGLGRTGAPREGWDAGNPAPTAVQATREFRPLFPNAAELDAAWYRRTGIYPMHGVLCIKDSVLEAHPELPGLLTGALRRAKDDYLEGLAARGAQGGDDAKWLALQAIVGPDPLPFGLAENAATIEALIDYAYAQQLIPRRYAPDELFLPV